MFNRGDAKVYDLSQCNPYIVGIIAFIICLFGSINTYYDQFVRVSELPMDRNELTPLKHCSLNNKANQIEANFTIEAIFSITKENFIRSLGITINSGIFSVDIDRGHLSEVKFDGRDGFCMGLSPIYGSVSASLNYLTTEILRKDLFIPHIAWLYPGMTLACDQKDKYHFSNIAFHQNELWTFSSLDFRFSELEFENGRKYLQHPDRRNSKDVEGQCQRINERYDLFVEPETTNPIEWFRSVLNPIASVYGSARIAVLTNSQNNTFRWYLTNYFEGIRLIEANECVLFSEVTVHHKVSNDFMKSRSLFNPVDDETRSPMIVSDTNLSMISKATTLICDNANCLANMLFMPRHSSVLLSNGEIPQWAQEMSDQLDINITRDQSF